MRRCWGTLHLWAALAGMAVASVSVDSASAAPQPLRGQSRVGSSVAMVPFVGESLDTRSLIDAWLDSVEQFWIAELAATDGPERAPVVDAIAYDPTDESSLPRCNGSLHHPSYYVDNAFYCHQENAIVYDAVGLVPDLRAAHGDLAVGVLVAHEYGHSVQAQRSVTGSRLDRELQADCFAGAWASTPAIASRRACAMASAEA